MQTIDNLIGRLLAPLDGYKTKVGSWMLMALAANQAVPFLPPTLASVLHLAALALMGYGLRDAIAKFAPP